MFARSGSALSRLIYFDLSMWIHVESSVVAYLE